MASEMCFEEPATEVARAPVHSLMAPDELAPLANQLALALTHSAPSANELAPAPTELAPSVDELAPSPDGLASSPVHLATLPNELAPLQLRFGRRRMKGTMTSRAFLRQGATWVT